jgi:hypothetical protein
MEAPTRRDAIERKPGIRLRRGRIHIVRSGDTKRARLDAI